MPLERLTDRLLAAHRRLEAARPAVDAGAPWPPTPAFGTEPEASWNPPELLAHLAEMLPFWIGQIDRILDGIEPVSFGRVADDDQRIGAIGRDRALPIDERYARVAAGVDAAVARFRALDEAQAARIGTHPTRGEMTVERAAERFIVGHLEEHADQLDAIVSGGGAPR